MQLPSRSTELISVLAQHEGVVAIGVGGSQASGMAATSSDFDIYVLTRKRVDPEFRRELIAHVADEIDSAEIANPYWGDEDAFLLDGIWHDLVFFDADWFFGEIDAVIKHQRVREGYTTSFVHTLAKMVVLHDPEQLISTAREQIADYPDELAAEIIEHNLTVSSQIHASYRNQIARAVELADPVSVNHRVAAFLACVFDIAFAALRIWHPGEKRQLHYLRQHERELPAGFVDHIENVLESTSQDRWQDLIAATDLVVADIEELASR